MSIISVPERGTGEEEAGSGGVVTVSRFSMDPITLEVKRARRGVGKRGLPGHVSMHAAEPTPALVQLRNIPCLGIDPEVL